MNDRPPEHRSSSASKAGLRLAGLVAVLLGAGCAGIEPAPQIEVAPRASPSQSAAVEPAAVLPEQPRGAVASAQGDTAMVGPIVVPVAPSAAGPAAHGTATTVPPAATPPARSPGPAAPVAAPATRDAATPGAAVAKAPPPLDLKSLESRLKATERIGVFTKLALKNQVDDLLDQFRAYYGGRLKVTLADLRRRYDLLVLKVLALLQDADPPLAHAIAASREAIWGILADPAKFASV